MRERITKGEGERENEGEREGERGGEREGRERELSMFWSSILNSTTL